MRRARSPIRPEAKAAAPAAGEMSRGALGDEKATIGATPPRRGTANLRTTKHKHQRKGK